jgi:hypothetical protein
MLRALEWGETEKRSNAIGLLHTRLRSTRKRRSA